MVDRILLVEETPSASREILERQGYEVTTARASQAVAKAHETVPSLMIFMMSRGMADVARTLGYVHGVPMVFVGAKRDEIRDVPRRHLVADHQPFVNTVKGALLSR